ncbi:MAG: right-handed parallel beta-helix repeat-containing protein [Thermoplasmata archaeon]|nr:right-handed parallel beta-helix repeat-containing protein [Thermoplasmata archaeon]
MHRRTVLAAAVVLASVLILSPLASASVGAHGAAGPDTPFRGVLTISPSCVLSNSAAPVSQSGTTFTLTANWSGSLTVLCPGATIDGAGYTLTYSSHPGGNPGVALTVNDSVGVTVEDLIFGNVTNGVSALDSPGLTVEKNTIPYADVNAVTVSNSSQVSVINNRLNGSAQDAAYFFNVTGGNFSGNFANGSYFGFQADVSTDVTADNNNLSFNPDGYGVGFYATNDSNASENQAFDDEYSLWADNSNNDSFYANTADDSTLYAVYLSGDSAVTANDNRLLHSSYDCAVRVEGSSDTTVQGDNASHSGCGFSSLNSHDVVFEDDNASYAEFGYYGEYTTGLSITDDQAFANYGEAVYLDGTSSTLVTDLRAPFSADGVYAQFDNATTIVGNNFSNSADLAVDSTVGSQNLVIENNILANSTEAGVYVGNSAGPVTISGNDLAHGLGIGIGSDGTFGPLTIQGNNGTRIHGVGVAIDDAYDSVTISGNDFSYSGATAVYLESLAAGASISGNDLAHAALLGLDDYDAYGNSSISGNNASDTETGIEVEGSYGSTMVTANTATNTTESGIELLGVEGPVTVTDNVVSQAKGIGIDNEDSTGFVSIDDNQGVDANISIGDFEPSGASSIVDNDVVGSTTAGIFVDYASDLGAVLVQGNNASGSKGFALYFYDNEFGNEPILGNNLSNSHEVEINDSESVQFVGNDLRNDAKILMVHSAWNDFDHNDFNTTAFNGSNSSMEIGDPWDWNAVYPIGGNYWSGYAGKDLFSGPAQNVAGSDGIGDTPQPIPDAAPSYFDAYPLMHPWTLESSILQFTETGLPSDAVWSVAVTYHGAGSGTTTGWGTGSSSVTIATTFGAATPYSFVVSAVPGYLAAPASGSGTTTAGTTTTSITFTAVVYTASFVATGIASGTSWTVTVNGQMQVSTLLTENLSIGNGTYAWTATTAGAPTVGGSVTVNGQTVSVSVPFHLPMYDVAFTQVGLASGATWTVNVDGMTQTSGSSVVEFTVPNGTYAYTITTTGSTAPTPSSGSVTVAGTGAAVPVTFGSYSSSPAGGSTGSSVNVLWLYVLAAVAAVFAVIALIAWTRKSGGGSAPAAPPSGWTPSTAPPPGAAPAPPPPGEATPPGPWSPPPSQ